MLFEQAGYYNDGKTAQRRAVAVRLGPDALEITDAAGLLLASWPYRDLRAVDAIRRGAPLRLARGSEDEARLTLVDDALSAELRARAPGIASGRRPSGRDLRRLGIILGAVAAGLAAFWFFWPPLADVIAAAVPPSWETQLGRQVASSMSGNHPVCDDPAGMAALESLTARLAAKAESPFPLTVEVIDHPGVNAFAAPGGRIILLRGLVESAESADELAGVLAHEVGHVTERHGMRVMVRYFGLMLLGQVFAGGSDLAQFAPVVVTLFYSRDFEASADERAVTLLTRAGLRADGLSRFFARMERQEKHRPAILSYLSSHPSTLERRKATLPETVRGEPALTAQQWAALQGICKSFD